MTAKNTNSHDDDIQEFLDEVNSHLPDFLVVRRNNAWSFPVFSLFLHDNDFVMEDQIAIKKGTKFFDLIIENCVLFFGKKPMFNNTGITFWV